MAQLSGMQIPADIAEKFAKLADDVQGTRKLGVEIVEYSALIEKLNTEDEI